MRTNGGGGRSRASVTFKASESTPRGSKDVTPALSVGHTPTDTELVSAKATQDSQAALQRGSHWGGIIVPNDLSSVQNGLLDVIESIKNEVELLFAEASKEREIHAMENDHCVRNLERSTKEDKVVAKFSEKANQRTARRARVGKLQQAGEHKVQVIESRPRQKVVVDSPQVSDTEHDDADDDKKSSSESSKDGGESGDSDNDDTMSSARRLEEESALENWKLDAASDSLELLLASLNVEERTAILQELGDYFAEKHPILEMDASNFDKMDSELGRDRARLDVESERVREKLDEREASMYSAFWTYYQTLHGLAVKDKDPEQDRDKLRNVQELKKQVLDLPAGVIRDMGVTSSDILAIVAGIQEEINSTKALLELEESRNRAYDHAARALVMAAELAGSDGDDPLQDAVTAQVIREVRQWERDGYVASANWYEAKDQKESEDAWDAVSRLTAECDHLRELIAEEDSKAKAFRENPDLVHLTAIANNDQYFARRGRRRAHLNSAGVVSLADDEDAPKPWEASKFWCYDLFDEDTYQQYLTELARIRDEIVKNEAQIKEFQDLQKLAASAVPILEDSGRRLNEASKASKKSLQIGALPDDEHDDTTLLRELKEVNEKIDKKQEADHRQIMDNLEKQELELQAEVKDLEAKMEVLWKQAEQEDEKMKGLQDEIDKANAKFQEVAAELEDLPQSSMKAEKTKADLYEMTNVELEAEVKAAEARLQAATKEAEAHMKSFEQTRQSAVDLISTMKHKVEKKIKRAKTPKQEDGADALAKQEGGSGSVSVEDGASQVWRSEGADSAITDREPAVEEEEPESPATVASPPQSPTVNFDESSADIEKADIVDGRPVLKKSVTEAGMPAEKLEKRNSEHVKKAKKRMSLLHSVTSPVVSPPSPPPVSSPQSKKSLKSITKRISSGSGVFTREMEKAAKIKRLLDEAQRDEELSVELEAKTEELEQHLEKIEARVMQLKGLISPDELNLLLSQEIEETPERILSLRKEVRAKKKDYDRLKAHWWNIRELAKRGGRTLATGGKDADNFRKDILKICDAALAEVGKHRAQTYSSDMGASGD